MVSVFPCWLRHRLKQEHRTLASLLVVVPVGFYSKYYRGPASDWVNNSLGGTFYVIFWCLLLSCVMSRWMPERIALLVLGATCGLEFLQLWHPPLLEALRSHFLGATILGTTFAWSDFPYYFAGSAIAWLWLQRLRRRKSQGEG